MAGFTTPATNSVVGALSGDLRSKYLTDPRLALAQTALQAGSSAAPVQGGIGEGLARVFQGWAGGKELGDLENDYKGKEATRADTVANALSLGIDQPAETKKYDDGTTINWDARAGNQDAMIKALTANPDTQDMASTLQLQRMQGTTDLNAKLAELKLANQLKGAEPITPYQKAQLGMEQRKLNAGLGGISYTMPDGTQIQIGGTGKGGKINAEQGQAASRSTMIGDGLKSMENLISSPQVSPVRMALANSIGGSNIGDLAATSMRTPQEQQLSAATDSALEGLASAVTGAGVTSDQFTRFKNMLPNAADASTTKDAKFDQAYNFLLTQTNIAGPIAKQIQDHVVERNLERQQNKNTAGGLSTEAQPAPANPALQSLKSKYGLQ